MTSNLIDRLAGVAEGLAVKAPCGCATTGNITLAGLAPIDGVTPVEGDTVLGRVLVKDQTDEKQNGIFNASSGNWTRAADFDGTRDVVRGTLVPVVSGGASWGGTVWEVASTDDPITFGVSNIVFDQPAWAQTQISAASLAITRAQIADHKINVLTVTVAGFRDLNDKGAGATYSSDGATSTGLNAIQDADGTWFNYVRGETVSAGHFGAIADGSSHPLSSKYATLAAAQADYPFATADTQEIDYCACVAAGNACFGKPGSEHGNAAPYLSRRLYLPAGEYQFGTDVWTIRNLASGVISGAGFNVTQLHGTGYATMQFDGLWYTRFEAFAIYNSGGTVALAMDGVSSGTPGHTYATFGVQGCSFSDMFFVTTGQFCVTLGFYSAGAGQGSENQFFNCHWYGPTKGAHSISACLYQAGFNALDNLIIGGDMQFFDMHGVYSNNSPISVIGTSFESTYGYTQYTNGGYDIYIAGSGVAAGCTITGCRSESMRFFYNAGSNIAAVSGCNGNTNLPTWFANNAYGSSSPAILVGNRSPRHGQVWIATTPGTSGGSEPTWPADPIATTTVSDGTITWTYLPFYFIYNGAGSVDFRSCQNIYSGGTIFGQHSGSFVVGPITADYTVGYRYTPENTVAVDATGGPITIYLSQDWGDNPYPITIKKIDSSSNAVTVNSSKILGTGFEGGATTNVIPGGSFGARTYELTAVHTIGITAQYGAVGAVVFPYVAKTANYTANLATNYFIDCTANTFTVTLPTAVGNAGKTLVIKNSGTGVITVATTSAQTIDGGATATLAVQYTAIPVTSDGANWKVS